MPKYKLEKPLNQYSTLPLTIGAPTDFTRPLILELFDSGQGKEVLDILYVYGLKIKETYKKPGFKLFSK